MMQETEKETESKKQTNKQKTKLPGDVSTPPFREAAGCRKANHSQAERSDHRTVGHLWCIPASVPGTSGFWRASEEDPYCWTMSRMRKIVVTGGRSSEVFWRLPEIRQTVVIPVTLFLELGTWSLALKEKWRFSGKVGSRLCNRLAQHGALPRVPKTFGGLSFFLCQMGQYGPEQYHWKNR